MHLYASYQVGFASRPHITFQSGFQVYSSLQHAFSVPWTDSSWPFFALLAMLAERLTGSGLQAENGTASEGLWKAWLRSPEWSPPALPAVAEHGACDAEAARREAQSAGAEGVRELAKRCLEDRKLGLKQLESVTYMIYIYNIYII